MEVCRSQNKRESTQIVHFTFLHNSFDLVHTFHVFDMHLRCKRGKDEERTLLIPGFFTGFLTQLDGSNAPRLVLTGAN